MRLVLVRHGQTPNNVAGALDTAYPGAGLTALGHTQAAAVPQALAAQVTALHASPLVRTQLTAQPLGDEQGLAVTVVGGLEEISAGEVEMRSDEASVRTYAECVLAWMEGTLDTRMPGAEDGHEFLARYDAAVLGLTRDHADDATLVAVSHGAAIRAWTAARATGLDRVLDAHGMPGLRLANTGASVLDGDPVRGWQVVAWVPTPLGGAHLLDAAAHDVTSETGPEQAADQDA